MNKKNQFHIWIYSIYLCYSRIEIRLFTNSTRISLQTINQNDENITVNESVPRGRILDRNGKVLVDNASKMSITYTRNRKTSQKEMLNTAKKLTDLIKMDTDKITERDKKDFWIQMYPSSAKKLMRKEQLMLEDGSISQEQFDTQLRDKIGKTIKTVN